MDADEGQPLLAQRAGGRGRGRGLAPGGRGQSLHTRGGRGRAARGRGLAPRVPGQLNQPQGGRGRGGRGRGHPLQRPGGLQHGEQNDCHHGNQQNDCGNYCKNNYMMYI